MKVNILASGSKGNATIIETLNLKILIDIGISYQKLETKLNELNLKPKNITHLLITHEHSDHLKGLSRFLTYNPNVLIYLTKGTYDALSEKEKNKLKNFEIIRADINFNIETININTFILSHDANEPVGFVISDEKRKVVIATDTGYIDQKYFNLLKDANLYILEANHDPNLLMNSRRPYYLKQRILGDRGHLNNEEAAYLINLFIKDIDKSIWAVSHISEDCNTIYNIEKAIVDYLEDPTKIKVIYTSQNTSETIYL